jgi:hypothetical protein
MNKNEADSTFYGSSKHQYEMIRLMQRNLPK